MCKMSEKEIERNRQEEKKEAEAERKRGEERGERWDINIQIDRVRDRHIGSEAVKSEVAAKKRAMQAKRKHLTRRTERPR